MANYEVPSAVERTLIASVISALSGASFGSYIVLFATILHSKELRSNPFYQVLFSLAINDALCELSYLINAAPSTYIGFVFSSVFDIVVNAIGQEIVWFHSTILLVFQSFNRLVFFCYPEKYERVFGGRRIWYFIGASWVVGFAMGLPTLWPCCQSLYIVDEYAFSYTGEFGATVMGYIDLGYSLVNLLIVMIVHICIFHDVHKKGRTINCLLQPRNDYVEQKRRRREARVLVQLFICVILQIVYEICGIVVPLLTTSRFGTLFGTVAEIAAMASNGVVFLFFNKTVNEEAAKMLRSVWLLVSCRSSAHGSSQIQLVHFA